MSKQHKAWNPLAKRHFKQIFHRPDALKRDLCSVWGLTWRPGGKKSSFIGDLYRPLGAATMMAQASYRLEDGREGIALAGVTAQIDPTSLVVSYDDIRLSHDLHRVPFEGARGTILDPGPERRGTRGNASWVELALDLDLLRKRAVLQRFRLSAIPTLPRFYLGYVSPERVVFAETPELRRRAAASICVEWEGRSLEELGRLPDAIKQKQLAAFAQLSPEDQDSTMRAMWRSAFISPADPENCTGLWLLPHGLVTEMTGVLRVFEYFGDLVGARVFNPTRFLVPEQVLNPAREVAAAHGVDLIADLACLATTTEGLDEYRAVEERIVSLLPAYRQKLKASESISDQDLLAGLCQHDEFVVTVPPLQALPDRQQVATMRAQLRPYISDCCTDEDILAAVRNPHGPLIATGLCRAQVLRRDPSRPLSESLRFTGSALGLDRVEVCLWEEGAICPVSRKREGSRLAVAA